MIALRIRSGDDDRMPAHSDASRVDRHLGDFTLTPRVLIIVAVALPIGALGAVAAWVLLRLIGLVTHLVFYGQVGFSLVAPAAEPRPTWLIRSHQLRAAS